MTIPATAPVANPRHHKPVPELPEVGTITYERFDGSTKVFRMRPYLHETTDWAKTFPTVADAVNQVAQHNHEYYGVAFGVFQAAEGAYQLRPMESQNGAAFFIDGPEFPAKSAKASADAGPLQAIVGWDHWIDFSGDRNDQLPKPV